MLDTYGRKYVNPIIDKTAKDLLKLNLKPNHVTGIAFFVGVLSGVFVYLDLSLIGVILLWVSGFLDAVDGSMARISKNTSALGTLMDITFDRVVEMSIVIALAMRFPSSRIYLLILTICILFSMTIFLTVGALSDQKGIKSFYYQAGLAERTEGFIMFSLMSLFTPWLVLITNLFSAAVFFTAAQRIVEAKRILN
ncbi:CDP-alcohol phosphatidyltransferase family protein [Clostridium sp. YIM B02515]|uniref:CDP-alcohol phosphatidyltransferase family protein n=1 Tax=Clostridium rhizosphaerae TaxID=2803861 RepID=A0ABS1T4N8_9CLOT|nr:CDP-alcohol phosphatidyltransferase family protein [Clostridium rhizosphaerae]MBL4934280.1 CDP-alcohol phosphatidyltransferase family protein [Clostridium rhizosphaerae]